MRILVEGCELTIAEARGIAAAEAVVLSEPALRSLARAFLLSPELLSCLLRPVSGEVLVHTIVAASAGRLDVTNCDMCADLDGRVSAAHSNDEHEELLGLCADVLEHTFSFDEPGGELFDEATAEAAMKVALPASLADVLAQLEPAARLRVMAYAYQELAQSTDGRSASSFAAYARLRSGLAPFVRYALDALSQAPEGMLEWQELAQAMPRGATLQGILNATQSGVAGLRENGLALSEQPLIVAPGPPVCLRLSAPARLAWCALVSAERLSAA
jgi:hypothetical protein